MYGYQSNQRQDITGPAERGTQNAVLQKTSTNLPDPYPSVTGNLLALPSMKLISKQDTEIQFPLFVKYTVTPLQSPTG
jgi:hypothetical protein